MTTRSPATPPAEPFREEPAVLNGLVTENLRLMVEVPQVAVMDGDMICLHPDDGTPVGWRVTSRGMDDEGRFVVKYQQRDGEEGEHPFTTDDWVMVEASEVYR